MQSSTSNVIAEFFSQFPERNYDKGQILAHADEAPTHIFYLEEGRVNQYDVAPNGTVVVVNVFKPGAFFAMSWAINGPVNHFFFESSTPVKVRLVPLDEALDFIKRHPDVTLDLLSRIYRGMDGVLQRVTHLMGGDAKSRLHYELLNASYRFGEQQDDNSLYVPLTESDLAAQTGLARETVNRHMQKLKELELVKVSHRGFTVPNLSELEKAVNGGRL